MSGNDSRQRILGGNAATTLTALSLRMLGVFQTFRCKKQVVLVLLAYLCQSNFVFSGHIGVSYVPRFNCEIF